MKNTKLMIMAVAILFLCSGDVYARGGGGHMGGGGGWSGGGRSGGFSGGGGGFERGGSGEFRGGVRPGQGGSGEYHGGGGDHGDHGDGHRRNNNNDNNNNTTNTYNVSGWGPGWDGGWGYGAADDALAGMAMGTMIATAASQPSTVVVEQPTTVVQQVVPGAPPIGSQVAALPGVCSAINVNGVMAYQCGTSWYRPYFGANGVYYQVVSPPPAGQSPSDQVVQ